MQKFVMLDFRAVTIIIIIAGIECLLCASNYPIVVCIFSFDPDDSSILQV